MEQIVEGDSLDPVLISVFKNFESQHGTDCQNWRDQSTEMDEFIR